MTNVMCCPEAKSGDQGEAILDVAIWRSLAISSRSVLVVGGADTEKGSVFNNRQWLNGNE